MTEVAKDVAKASTEWDKLFGCDPASFRNLFGLEQYRCKTSFFGGSAPLSLGVGFFIVLGFGLVFGLFTVGLVYLERKFSGNQFNSEFFNTAGRSIGTALTASVIVSQVCFSLSSFLNRLLFNVLTCRNSCRSGLGRRHCYNRAMWRTSLVSRVRSGTLQGQRSRFSSLPFSLFK